MKLIETNSSSYRPQLDGLRAFCIVFTVWQHVTNKPSWIDGNVGVDVFFALSGWLITRLLLNEHSKHGSVSLNAFYIRRIFRILPLYYVAVIIYAILGWLSLEPNSPNELKAAWPYMLSLNMEFRPQPIAGALFGQAWTLGIEEKFYLLWPLFLLISFRRPFVSLTLSLLSVALLAFLFGEGALLLRGYGGLAAGAGLALLTFRAGLVRRLLERIRLADVAAPALLVPYLMGLYFPHPYVWHLAIAGIAALLVASLWTRQDQAVARFLAMPTLAWLGTLTYAIYLAQTAITVLVERMFFAWRFAAGPWLTFFVSYGVSVLVAWIAHRSVERPLIGVGRRLARRVRAGAGEMVSTGASRG